MISVLLRLFLLFLFSLVSNATAFFGASYTLIATAELSAFGVNLESFTLVVFVTALGATLGKIVIYFTAVGLQKSLLKNRNVRLLGTWLGKSGFYLGLFITALLPDPAFRRLRLHRRGREPGQARAYARGDVPRQAAQERLRDTSRALGAPGDLAADAPLPRALPARALNRGFRWRSWSWAS